MNKIVVKSILVMRYMLAAMHERATRAQRGQGLVEYVLILAFIALVVVVAMKVLPPAISHTLNQTACTLESAGTSTPVASATPCP